MLSLVRGRGSTGCRRDDGRGRGRGRGGCRRHDGVLRERHTPEQAISASVVLVVLERVAVQLAPAPLPRAVYLAALFQETEVRQAQLPRAPGGEPPRILGATVLTQAPRTVATTTAVAVATASATAAATAAAGGIAVVAEAPMAEALWLGGRLSGSHVLLQFVHRPGDGPPRVTLFRPLRTAQEPPNLSLQSAQRRLLGCRLVVQIRSCRKKALDAHFEVLLQISDRQQQQQQQRDSCSGSAKNGTNSTTIPTTSTTTTSAASWKQRTGIRLWASEPLRAVLSSVVPLGRTCTLVIGTDHAAILCGPALLRGHRARALATYTPRSRKCNNGIRCAGRKTLDDADLG